MSITTILFWFLLSWFITNFEPFQNLLLIVEDKLYKKKKDNKLIQIVQVLRCIKCTGFWITLIFSFNFFMALLISFIGYIYSLLICKNK